MKLKTLPLTLMIRLRKIIVAHHQISEAEISGRFIVILEAIKLSSAFVEF